MSAHPSLFRSTLLLTAVGAVNQGLFFLYRIALARLAGAEVMGLYQLIMPVYALMQSVCISGLVVTVSMLSSELHARANERALRQLMGVSLRGLLWLWLPMAAVVLTRAAPIAQTLLGDERAALGLWLLPPVLLLTGVENLQKHHFYGIGSVKIPAGVEIGEQVVRTAGTLLLLTLFAGQTQETLVGVIVLGLLISEIFSSTALTVLRLRRQHKASMSGTNVPIQKLRRRMVSIALPVSLTALVGNLMGAATSVLIPKLLVTYGLSTTEALESFGVLMGMTLPLLTIPNVFINALSLALLPRLTEQRELGQMPAFRRTSEKALLAVSFVILPLIALTAALGTDLGVLLFGDARVGRDMLPLAVAVGAGCYHAILVCILNALGRQKQSAAISLLCGGVELALTCALVGAYGLSGFAVALLAADFLAVVLCLLAAVRGAGIQIDCYRCFSAPVLSAVLAGLVIHLVYHGFLDQGLTPMLSLALCALGGCGLYLAAMLAQGIRPIAVIRWG